MATECQTCTVQIEDNQTGMVGTLVVPAYTVEPGDFREYVIATLERYLSLSVNAQRVSAADFAFYLLALASQQPRFIEEP